MWPSLNFISGGSVEFTGIVELSVAEAIVVVDDKSPSMLAGFMTDDVP